LVLPGGLISMDELLAKLPIVKEFLIASIPTIILLIILHAYLKRFFFGPLDRALEERKKATEGANKLAHQSFEATKKKTAEYEEKLRNARSEIYQEQERRRNELRAHQEAALQQVRAKTDAMLAEARKQIEADSEAARRDLEAEADAIADRIAAAVMNGRNN
jgi:F-type H+-transporting ATPase subunit b